MLCLMFVIELTVASLVVWYVALGEVFVVDLGSVVNVIIGIVIRVTVGVVVREVVCVVVDRIAVFFELFVLVWVSLGLTSAVSLNVVVGVIIDDNGNVIFCLIFGLRWEVDLNSDAVFEEIFLVYLVALLDAIFVDGRNEVLGVFFAFNRNVVFGKTFVVNGDVVPGPIFEDVWAVVVSLILVVPLVILGKISVVGGDDVVDDLTGVANVEMIFCVTVFASIDAVLGAISEVADVMELNRISVVYLDTHFGAIYVVGGDEELCKIFDDVICGVDEDAVLGVIFVFD